MRRRVRVARLVETAGVGRPLRRRDAVLHPVERQRVDAPPQIAEAGVCGERRLERGEGGVALAGRQQRLAPAGERRARTAAPAGWRRSNRASASFGLPCASSA